MNGSAMCILDSNPVAWGELRQPSVAFPICWFSHTSQHPEISSKKGAQVCVHRKTPFTLEKKTHLAIITNLSALFYSVDILIFDDHT